jgi:Zc3h12a-like Ribonuclease NYN domain
MSESRPKLVQEGLPLTNANPKDSKSLSTLASSSAGNAGTSTKSKFRIVIGGENENAELPDDPDQYQYSGYHHGHHPNNFAMNNPHHYSAPYYPRPGRGGGNFYRGGRGGRYDTGYFRGRGSYDTRNYDHSYDIRNRAYDHYHQFNRVYDNHYNTYPDHNDNYKFGKRIIKNPKSPGLIQSRFVIGQGNGDQNNNSNSELSTVDDEILMELEEVIPQTYNEELHQIERMEGVISLDALEPLVVIDGANVAYAYADAISAVAGTNQREPDHRGIQVAVDYFQQANIRVLVVLPAPWFRLKPRPGDAQSGRFGIL